MAAEMKGRVIGGEGKVAEVDAGYFGGYVKAANLETAPSLIGASSKTSPASVRPLLSSASAMAARYPPCFALRDRLFNWVQVTDRQGDRGQRRRSRQTGTNCIAVSR